MNMKNYIFEQINANVKLGQKVFFLTRKSFDQLADYIVAELLKRNGNRAVPTIFSPFYSDNKFSDQGIGNIIIRASNGVFVTACKI